jgi:hypothetical protein
MQCEACNKGLHSIWQYLDFPALVEVYSSHGCRQRRYAFKKSFETCREELQGSYLASKKAERESWHPTPKRLDHFVTTPEYTRVAERLFSCFQKYIVRSELIDKSQNDKITDSWKKSRPNPRISRKSIQTVSCLSKRIWCKTLTSRVIDGRWGGMFDSGTIETRTTHHPLCCPWLDTKNHPGIMQLIDPPRITFLSLNVPGCSRDKDDLIKLEKNPSYVCLDATRALEQSHLETQRWWNPRTSKKRHKFQKGARVPSTSFCEDSRNKLCKNEMCYGRNKKTLWYRDSKCLNKEKLRMYNWKNVTGS